MGLFHVKGHLTGPTGRVEEIELLVDTGATLSVVPRSLAEKLELKPTRSQRVVIAGGQREVWPIAEARLVLNGDESRSVLYCAGGSSLARRRRSRKSFPRRRSRWQALDPGRRVCRLALDRHGGLQSLLPVAFSSPNHPICSS